MSHELRTPLNCSLILAKLLADNKAGNLTAEQVKFAQTIYSAGNDLLDADQRHPRSVQDRGRQGRAAARAVRARRAGRRRWSSTSSRSPRRRSSRFADRHRARTRPSAIETDAQRLGQILKNLLSNAIKFTERGQVDAAGLRAGDGARRVRRPRHRHRHPGAPAGAHLRGVPPGRRQHAPQVRRHRPRPVDLARPGAPARRRHHACTARRARAAPSRLTLPAGLRRGAAADSRRPRRAGRAAAPRRSRRRHAGRAGRGAASPRRDAVDDDRDRLDAGRAPHPRHRRRRARSPRILRDLAHELGFQCLVAHTADDGLAPALQLPPERHPARHQPAGPLRPRRARSAQARPARPGTSRCTSLSVADYSPARRSSCGADRLRAQAGQARASWSRRSAGSKPSSRRACAACWWSKTTRGSARASASCSASDGRRDHRPSRPPRRRSRSCARTTFDCMVIDLTLPDVSGYELLEQMAEQEDVLVPAGHRLHRAAR